jgi:protein TonB
MIAGHAAEQGLLASRIASEAVFRFVHKPASAQRLRTFLEAASREAGRPRETSVVTGAPKPPSKTAFVAAGVVAALLAVVAAWLFWPHGAAARLNARDLAKVQEMLSQAGTAMGAKRFVSFDGSSASELYRGVLGLDDRNEQARAGLDSAIKGAIAAALQSLGEGKLDDATNTMEAARQVDPQHPGLKDLIAQVDAETRRQLADAKARTAMLERQSQIRTAVEKVQASIRSGALLEPASDNAITQFQAAQALSPGDAAVRAARSDLTAALVDEGEKAAASRRLADARRFASAASRVNSSAPGLAALQRHIDDAAAPPPASVASATRRAPAVAAPATVDEAPSPPVASAVPPPAPAAPPPTALPPAPEPAPVTAAAEAPVVSSAAKPVAPVWVPGEGVVAASKLKLVRGGTPDYPPEARASQTSGWVEMEFTVQKNGTVKDVAVSASEPRRVFDAAAAAAMRGYRFTPVLRDGQPVEQRAKLRMRFTFQDQ